MTSIESLALECEGKCHGITSHKYVTESPIRDRTKIAVVYRCEKCEATNVLYKKVGWRRYG